MSDYDLLPRLSRLTAILLKLQTRPYVSVKQLAEEFGVTTRTIYRDLSSLEDSGVPLVSEEGRGYTLVEGYHIPPVMFTEGEAQALITAEKIIAKTEDASLIEQFTHAIDKIRSVLDHEDKEKAHLLSERTLIGKNWQHTTTSSYLADIQHALTNYKVLLIHYQKANESPMTTREIEPFAIYNNTSEHWVLIAWCRLREDFRNFRLDRIRKLRIQEETFPPHPLTLKEYVEIQRKKYFYS